MWTTRAPAVPSARDRRAPLRHGWIAPAAAVVAVLAIALSLVLVRVMPNGRAASSPPPVSTAGAPLYYVALARANGSAAGVFAPLAGQNEVTPSWDAKAAERLGGDAVAHLVVGATFTGKQLATVQPPAGLTFAGVTAAADDRTFVVDATPLPRTRDNADGLTVPRTWYLLRISPGTAGIARLTRLPIAVIPEGTYLFGMALSPDGTKLAVAETPGKPLYGRPGRRTVAVYAVRTGRLIRTWSSITDGFIGNDQNPVRDNHTALSWSADGSALAFNYQRGTFVGQSVAQGGYWMFRHSLRVIYPARPGNDLLGDSRVVWSATQKVADLQTFWPLTCRTDLLLTPDGTRLVCGAFGRNPPGVTRSSGGAACPPDPMPAVQGFVEYSAVTGKPAGTIGNWTTTCQLDQDSIALLWAGRLGSTLIGFMENRPPTTTSRQRVANIGVFTANGERLLPLLPAGTSDVAW